MFWWGEIKDYPETTPASAFISESGGEQQRSTERWRLKASLQTLGLGIRGKLRLPSAVQLCEGLAGSEVFIPSGTP